MGLHARVTASVPASEFANLDLLQDLFARELVGEKRRDVASLDAKHDRRRIVQSDLG